MSYSKLDTKAKTTIGSHTPNSFERQYTYINFPYIASSKSSEFAIWKACHGVLNASLDGCLTTAEVEKAIRLQYPKNNFVRNTLNHTLSQSDDFAQVFLQGRTPGRWFLTGKTGGVPKAAAKKARKVAEAASMSSASINDADIATSGDDLPIKELPFPLKMELTLPPTLARANRSFPTSVRGVDSLEAFARPSGGYQPYVPPSAVQALVDLAQPINLDTGSQFNRVPPLEIPSSATSIHYSIEELLAALDALQGLPLPPPGQVWPQDLLPEDDVYSNMPPAPGPTQATFDSFIFDPPFPEGADPFVPDVAYLGDLEVNTVDPQLLVGLFENETQQAPPQEELLKGHDFWKQLEENHGQTPLKLMPCGVKIAQEVLPVAYHTVVCMICTAATPYDEWCRYHSLVAADGIHYALPKLPTPPSEQPQAPEPEVPTAGLRFDASFDLLGMETQF